jgi:UDP-arabinose 4-epimerase
LTGPRRKVLVTGGAGYIGSHACKELFSLGYDPITFDNLSTGNLSHVKWGDLLVGDIRNTSDLEKAFAAHEFFAVFHFAGSAIVSESMKKPFFYANNNIGGSLNLVEVMLKSEIGYLIFSSSCATYGEPDIEYISEDLIQNPINPYGYSKLTVEKILNSLSGTERIKFATLRYFNVAGADPAGELGELHKDETHVIPLLIKSSLLREPFKLFGTDFNTPDGAAVRDFIHVSDLVQYHIRALELLVAGNDSFECNLGNGHGVSLLHLISLVENKLGKINVEIKGSRMWDPSRLVADISRMETLFKGEQNRYDISDIVETAIHWELSRN